MTVSQETCLKHACTAIKCDLLKNAFIYDIVSASLEGSALPHDPITRSKTVMGRVG